MTPLDYPIWLRATHFFNLLLLTLAMRSGLEILSAHPKLYWNDDCRPGSEWITFTRKKQPQHELELWTSRDEEEAFSSWIAMPGHKNLGLGRHWHFLTDIGWLSTGIVYVVLLFATGEWRRLVPVSWSIVPGAWHALVEYLSFHLVRTPGAYNPLQQLTYFSAVFLLAPLTILTGLAMSPALAARSPWYLKLFHGRQAARSLHFLCLCAFIGFFIVHVLMVFLHGIEQELALIVLGQTHAPQLGLALAVALLGIAVIVAVHIAGTQLSLRRPRLVQRRTQALIDPLRKSLFGRGLSAQAYPRSAISPYFRVNGRPPNDPGYEAMARNRFQTYELEVGGMVEKPLRLSLNELRALPRHTQITKHCCIQGWSAVAEWGGVELGRILQLCRPLPGARYVMLYAFDDKSSSEPDPDGPGYYYGSISMELARHPQTLLAYEMNGHPLPIAHGAPLRLRVETQLGFVMVKFIRAIELVAEYSHIGLGQGGWREDHQYYSPEAGL